MECCCRMLRVHVSLGTVLRLDTLQTHRIRAERIVSMECVMRHTVPYTSVNLRPRRRPGGHREVLHASGL